MGILSCTGPIREEEWQAVTLGGRCECVMEPNSSSTFAVMLNTATN